ncbi:hypothetical protein BC937DRAFT_89312 [Endogone sp. FLAS-F59071]|nr:hypothetical protein BC937DRAFT_89312 [Endogone sp. FLAS-F59071]|eukprot:RUS17958.1 hypothetical protein BC937DRAFT_89312 [Endogone sp. FLAS-F59071]
MCSSVQDPGPPVMQRDEKRRDNDSSFLWVIHTQGSKERILTKQEHGVIHTALFQTVNHQPGQCANVRPSVPADIGLVAHATQRDAVEAPRERRGNRFTKGSLANARLCCTQYRRGVVFNSIQLLITHRSNEADDWRLEVTFDLDYGQVFKDTFLYGLKAGDQESGHQIFERSNSIETVTS